MPAPKKPKKPIAKKPTTPVGQGGTPKANAWSTNWQNAGPSFARRAWYGSNPQDARRDVNPSDRLALIQKARYAEKNYPAMVQFINDMVMYVVGDGMMPTSHASDPAKARLYEEYYHRETRRADITGRFTGEQLQRIIVHTWAVDGEIFALKVRDSQNRAKTQLIEGHRVISPTDPAQLTKDTWDGFRFGPYGEVIGIWVQNDDQSFRLIPAESFMQVANQSRITSAHGIPPMQQALNSMQDQNEIIELEKRAVKQVTDVPSVLTKNGGFADASLVSDLNGGGATDFGNIGAQMGGKLLVLEPGEDLKSVSPNFPRQSMEMFNAILARMIASGGLPYEVVGDGSKAGSALVRMVLGKADRFVGQIQCMVHDDYCVPDWQWRISDGISKGLLPDDPKWSDVEFSVPQAPSIDNGRDSANDREDLRAGLTSFSAIAKKRGVDFRKTFKEHVQDILFAKQVVAETGGMVTFEEAMQRFTNMQPQPKEVEESAEDEAEDEAESGTKPLTDPEDEGDETEEQAPNPIIPN
jgi:capsid protein